MAVEAGARARATIGIPRGYRRGARGAVKGDPWPIAGCRDGKRDADRVGRFRASGSGGWFSGSVRGDAMKTLVRIRKVIKWGGLVAAALLLVVWLVSPWYWVCWEPSAGGSVSLDGGRLCIQEPRWGPPVASFAPDLNGHHVLAERVWELPGQRAGHILYSSWRHRGSPFLPGSGSHVWSFEVRPTRRNWYVAVPLWAPMVAILAATMLAWAAESRSRQRARRGRCPACNYDRAGLGADVVCPECGGRAR
jgi:hypothetical protein